MDNDNKITSSVYIEFLRAKLKILAFKLNFHAQQIPVHTAIATNEYLDKLGFRKIRIIMWLPDYLDQNPIDNLSCIVKEVYL